MMRSPHRVSTAVRKADGEIVVRNKDFVSFVKRYKILGLPLVRGIIEGLMTYDNLDAIVYATSPRRPSRIDASRHQIRAPNT